MEATTTLVLIGKTGNGKSATGNSILKRNEFQSRRSSKSVTEECKSGKCKWKDGRTINVVDTPGLFDTKAKKEDVDKEIVKSIELAKDGVHAFILVLSLRSRFTEEEASVVYELQMLFGKQITDYMVVLFTGGDELDEENDGFKLDDYINDSPPVLMDIINRCSKRVVVFDNKTKSETKRENQIAKLLKMVDQNIAQKGNRPYSNELFEKAKRVASELEEIRKKDEGYEKLIIKMEEVMKMKDEQMKSMEKNNQEHMKELKELMKIKDEQAKLRDEEAKKREQLQSEQIESLNRKVEESAKLNTIMGITTGVSSAIPLVTGVVKAVATRRCSIS